MALVSTAYEMPRTEAVIVAVAHQTTPENNAVELNDGNNCSVPPTASKPVKTARKISGMIIGIHAVALFFGRAFWGQWLASLIAITAACFVLCHFNRCAYISAVVLYTVGMAFDILTVLFWIMYAEALAEDITDDDIEKDRAERTIRLFSLTPAVGALCQLVGAIVVIIAVCAWKDSGAPDATPIIELSVRNICPDMNVPDALDGLVPYRGPETRDIELEVKIRYTPVGKMSRLEATPMYQDYIFLPRTGTAIVSTGQNVPESVSGSIRPRIRK